MKRTVKSSDYFKDPRNMSRIVRENAVASSAFEGACPQAIRLSSADTHRKRIASSKKRASGS